MGVEKIFCSITCDLQIGFKKFFNFYLNLIINQNNRIP